MCSAALWKPSALLGLYPLFLLHYFSRLSLSVPIQYCFCHSHCLPRINWSIDSTSPLAASIKFFESPSQKTILKERYLRTWDLLPQQCNTVWLVSPDIANPPCWPQSDMWFSGAIHRTQTLIKISTKGWDLLVELIRAPYVCASFDCGNGLKIAEGG